MGGRDSTKGAGGTISCFCSFQMETNLAKLSMLPQLKTLESLQGHSNGEHQKDQMNNDLDKQVYNTEYTFVLKRFTCCFISYSNTSYNLQLYVLTLRPYSNILE